MDTAMRPLPSALKNLNELVDKRSEEILPNLTPEMAKVIANLRCEHLLPYIGVVNRLAMLYPEAGVKTHLVEPGQSQWVEGKSWCQAAKKLLNSTDYRWI